MCLAHALTRSENYEPNAVCRSEQAFRTLSDAAHAALPRAWKAPGRGLPRRCQDRMDLLRALLCTPEPPQRNATGQERRGHRGFVKCPASACLRTKSVGREV